MKSYNKNDDLIINLRILNQIGASILSGSTVEEIIDTVYHSLNQLLDAFSFAIGIYNNATKRMEYTGARENDKKLPFFSIDAHSAERFSGWVFTHKKEILINNYEEEYQLYLPKPITPLQGIQPASLMYVPIFINKEIIGLLSVRTLTRHAYSLQKIEILKTLAVFIGKAFENAGNTDAHQHNKYKLPASYALNPLSARELEVLNLLSKGFKNRSIAAELYISASTVKTHTLNIYEKLEAENRMQAVIKAKEYRLIT